MQVKDVEKLTGLSTKAIRLYEEKGLIEVARNPLNDYRDYSEENVQLRKLARLVKLPWKYGLGLAGSGVLLTTLLISVSTAVTKDQIFDINLLTPSKEYLYSDVKSVWTGFGAKVFTLDEAEKQGQFSYRIQLDGKEIVFMQPTSNQDLVTDDTYIELEELDQRLMSLGIPKESSAEGSQYNDLDAHFIERFLRIVENK
ncbi:TPA: MerR family transcriptional regulator [Streptococcus suis]